jgi:RHS repeat-associated protein
MLLGEKLASAYFNDTGGWGSGGGGGMMMMGMDPGGDTTGVVLDPGEDPPGGGEDTCYTQMTYYVNDQYGSVRVGMSETSVLARIEYYPYGEVYSMSGGGSVYTFLGKEDPGVGMLDFGPRYYNAVLGRFMSPDPILAGASAYSYAEGNPIMMYDPSGMESIYVPTPEVLQFHESNPGFPTYEDMCNSDNAKYSSTLMAAQADQDRRENKEIGAYWKRKYNIGKPPTKPEDINAAIVGSCPDLPGYVGVTVNYTCHEKQIDADGNVLQEFDSEGSVVVYLPSSAEVDVWKADSDWDTESIPFTEQVILVNMAYECLADGWREDPYATPYEASSCPMYTYGPNGTAVLGWGK